MESLRLKSTIAEKQMYQAKFANEILYTQRIPGCHIAFHTTLKYIDVTSSTIPIKWLHLHTHQVKGYISLKKCKQGFFVFFSHFSRCASGSSSRLLCEGKLLNQMQLHLKFLP